MSLADRVDSPPPPRRTGHPCGMGVLLNSLDADERSALESMLASSAWTEPMIRDALRDEGYPIGNTMVGHHRRGNCACPKSSA